MAFNLKDYEEVKDRKEKFYAAHPTPEGRITTEMVSDANKLDTCVVKAYVWINDVLVGTGLAMEIWDKNHNVNSKSHVENCETSAIGRALANCGYKVMKDSPNPSREEMQKVQRPTSAQAVVSDDAKEIEKLQGQALVLIKASGRDWKDIHETYSDTLKPLAGKKRAEYTKSDWQFFVDKLAELFPPQAQAA